MLLPAASFSGSDAGNDWSGSESGSGGSDSEDEVRATAALLHVASHAMPRRPPPPVSPALIPLRPTPPHPTPSSPMQSAQGDYEYGTEESGSEDEGEGESVR